MPLGGVEPVADALRVKFPSVLVYDISGKGFTRLEGAPTMENVQLTTGENVAARVAEDVHRLGAHQQRMRGIQAARDADHDLLDARELEPFGQALDLDVEDLGAPLVAAFGVGRHIGEAFEAAGR